MYMQFTVKREAHELAPGSDYPEKYLLKIEGTAHDGPRIIGRVRAIKIQFGRITDERYWSWFEACDAVSQEIYEVYSAVCKDNDYREFLSDFTAPDLLYVQTMEITKDHRGNRLGQAMLLELMAMFEGGCAAVLIEPHPMKKELVDNHPEYNSDPVWEAAMDWTALAQTEQQYQEGAKKLRSYWRKLGFAPVPKSKRFMFRDCTSEHKVDETAIRSSFESDADADPNE
jgi:hypothetical protein